MGPDWLGGALLLPQHRLMIQPIAKCQSTISKCLMVALAGRHPPEALLPGERSLAMAVHASFHHGLQRFDGLTLQQQQLVLNDDSWIRMTAVRDPLERLLSFWWHKLVLLDPGYAAFCRLLPATLIDASSLTSLREGWSQFLDVLQSRPELLDQDHHLAPQSTVACADTIPYTHILRRGDFVPFWTDHLSTLKAERALPLQILSDYRQFYAPQIDLIRLISPTANHQRLVETLYAHDYQWLSQLPDSMGPMSVMVEPFDNHTLIPSLIRQIRDSHRLIAVASAATPASVPPAWPEHNRPESGHADWYDALQRHEHETVLATIDETSCLDGESLYLLGVSHHLQGDHHKALHCFDRCEELGFRTPYVLFNRGNACRALGDEINAIACYREAMAWFPSFGECQINCALALEKLDRLDEAETLLRQRLVQDRADSQAWFVLGNILRRGKCPQEAIEAFHGCLKLRPGHCDALNNLGLGYADLKLYDDAEACYLQALTIKADYIHSRRNLAQLMVRMRRHGEALPHYALWSTHAHDAAEKLVAIFGWLSVLAELDRCEEALALCKEMHSPALVLFCRCTVMPILFDSGKHVDEVRDRLESDLAKLYRIVLKAKLKDDEWRSLYRGLFCVSHFYLAYQLYNDRSFHEKYALIASTILERNISEPLSLGTPCENHNQLPRIGFISAHLRRHNGAHWALGWARSLMNADQPVQLFSYNLGEEEDDVTTSFAAMGQYRHLPLDYDNLEQVVRLIRADQLDLLLFTDVGMHAPSRVLSYFRLARIQAAAWGHPVTTGSPVVDFYLSGEAMEDDHSQDWYSEKLVTLPGTGLVYPNPALSPLEKDVRESLCLPMESKLLLSLQSTFKYHPAYDSIYARILESSSETSCVFVDHMGHSGLGEKLRCRLASAGDHPDDLIHRLYLLPRVPHHVYVSLFAIAHHVLDTPGWNGGNSSFQSLSMGCPVVTMRGNSMRGRHTVAMLEIIGLQELIAESVDQYVQISQKLLFDADFDRHCRCVISQNSHRLFDDVAAARAFEAWVRSVVSA